MYSNLISSIFYKNEGLFLSRIHIYVFLYVRAYVKKMFIHSLVLRKKNTLMWPPAYVFRRPYVFRKLLRMISLRTKNFVRKETHVSEEKKKKKKYCAITFELHSNVIFQSKVQIFVPSLSIITNKMAPQLAISCKSTQLSLTKVKDFHRKYVKKNAWQAVC